MVNFIQALRWGLGFGNSLCFRQGFGLGVGGGGWGLGAGFGGWMQSLLQTRLWGGVWGLDAVFASDKALGWVLDGTGISTEVKAYTLPSLAGESCCVI